LKKIIAKNYFAHRKKLKLFEKIILVEIILHIFVILAKVTVNSMYLLLNSKT